MYRHILVAVGTSLSHRALATAIVRARECNARLTALHVVDRTPWWAVDTGECNQRDTLSLIDEHSRALMRYSVSMIERAGIDGVGISVSLPAGGSIGEVIAKTANDSGADLVVLGGETESGWPHRAERLRDVVCGQTHCDVLIATHARAEPEAEAEAEVAVSERVA
ncbi:universal stress protein [Caballeronia sp. Lep1P3]|uniref:universal stress protein n=1 Tax=Caballeronia sp. Lep1P3 TaxID=2878150 RepID=UPI001FCFF300|nr:universal stress protein [Caballeronia sp. Lep1P3]